MISVVVPVYNIAPYIGRCIDSIIAQTYKDWELLLVDDGSTDESGSILDAYAKKDRRIRVFHKPNGGVSSARNRALDEMRGDYVSIIDGDDWVEPMLFEDAMAEMTRHQADVFMFEYSVDEGETRRPHHIGGDVYGICTPEQALIHSITPDNRFAWTKVFSSELLLTGNSSGAKRYDQSIILGEDTLFISEVLIDSKRTVYSPKVYYHYDQRQGSAVRSDFNPKKLSGIEAYKGVLKLVQDRGMLRVERHALVALFNLCIQLGRQIMKSPYADREHMDVIAQEVKPIRLRVLFSSEADRKTKIKAAVSMLSVRWTCRLLAGK